MEYDKIYKNNNSVWGVNPNPLLKIVSEKIDTPISFLDLGCGQGRDSIFMLQKGFEVIAVDSSQEGLNRISEIIDNNNLPKEKITLICRDVKDFNIEENHFSIIDAFNVFQFMDKEDVLDVIEKIKNGLILGGYVVISGFLKDNSNKGFFQTGELKKLFSDFAIDFYEEKIVDDLGHPGSPEPHQHKVVRTIAKKI